MSTGSLSSPILPQVIPSPGLLSGVSISSTEIYPDPNIPNRHVTQPNICNRRWCRDNNPFLPPQLSASALQSITTNVGHDQIYATDVGGPSISVRARSPSSPYAKSPPKFSNRLRSCSNYLQLMTRIPDPLSSNANAFEPGVAVPPGPSTPGLPPAFLLEALAILLLKKLFCLSFMVMCLARPLY